MKTSKVSYKKYKCGNCGHVKELQTNHYGECYGQAALRMNMCEKCSWKAPTKNIVWTCLEKDPTIKEGTEWSEDRREVTYTHANGVIYYEISADGTAFHKDTPPLVRVIIERARLDKRRVKITLGDVKTGRAWEDAPESGTIGRSTGNIKVPLLIKTARSHGGGALLDHCILRIETANKKDGGLLYDWSMLGIKK